MCRALGGYLRAFQLRYGASTLSTLSYASLLLYIMSRSVSTIDCIEWVSCKRLAVKLARLILLLRPLMMVGNVRLSDSPNWQYLLHEITSVADIRSIETRTFRLMVIR